MRINATQDKNLIMQYMREYVWYTRQELDIAGYEKIYAIQNQNLILQDMRGICYTVPELETAGYERGICYTEPELDIAGYERYMLYRTRT